MVINNYESIIVDNILSNMRDGGKEELKFDKNSLV